MTVLQTKKRGSIIADVAATVERDPESSSHYPALCSPSNKPILFWLCSPIKSKHSEKKKVFQVQIKLESNKPILQS